jgi:hypothetical protein
MIDSPPHNSHFVIRTPTLSRPWECRIASFECRTLDIIQARADFPPDGNSDIVQHAMAESAIRKSVVRASSEFAAKCKLILRILVASEFAAKCKLRILAARIRAMAVACPAATTLAAISPAARVIPWECRIASFECRTLILGMSNPGNVEFRTND